MMDEYIPSPRQTPNKHRRMRDVSSFYPVDENQLLLEAVLKQQRDNPSGDSGRCHKRTMNIDGPARDNSPSRNHLEWREERRWSVCHWPAEKSSASSASDDYDGDESDDTSGDDTRQVPESSSISSGTGEEEEDDDKEESEDGSSVDEGNDNASIKSADDEVMKKAENIQDEDTDVDDTKRDIMYLKKQLESSNNSLHLPQVTDPKERPPEREEFISSGNPGKLLYGRHCLWYQSAAFVRPHGGN